MYDCQLPIEIYHYPDELSSPTDRALLEGFGVDLREVRSPAQTQQPDPLTDLSFLQVDAAHSHSKGYQIKPYAFIDTTFTQFLYMDSVRPLAKPPLQQSTTRLTLHFFVLAGLPSRSQPRRPL